jgi:cytochrome b subunit of formate dehydrogenase
MYILNIYERPYYMCIQKLLLALSGLNIMHTCVYFEYIEVLCKIFTKYIVAILQVYPNYLTILLEIITNDI